MMMKTQMQRSAAISRRSAVRVCATGAPPPPPPAAVPVVPPPVVIPTPAPVAAMTVKDCFTFTGPGPETMNGRLSMLGFVAAIGAELTSQEPMLSQFDSAIYAVIATAAVFTVATIVPILKGANLKEAFGPFTPAAELQNGRAAMIGFASLLIFEQVTGKALL